MRLRLLLPALLAAVLLASAALPAASAQPPTFTQAWQVRGALGDIPTTAATEPGGSWNLEQRFTLAFTNTTAKTVAFRLPAGATLANASCTCGATPSASGRDVTFQLGASTPSGTHTLTVLSTQPGAAAIAFDLQRPVSAGDGVVILYVPNGSVADAPVADHGPGSSTDGSARIYEFIGDSLPQPFWASVHPGTAATAPNDDAGEGFELEWPWALGLGLLLGIVLWALLVQKGAVQRKGRKQVAATAAHVEAAQSEPAPVLEGRKRALLAALKEVEVARMNNEMPPEVYDAVKADFKKQAVTVMRALETADDSQAKP
jgi:hypothetical protein